MPLTSALISALTGESDLIKSYMLNSTQDYNVINFNDKRIVIDPLEVYILRKK